MPQLIDIVILALLVGTVGYVFLVERRVRALMEALRELEPMVGEFSAAVDKSESSVGMLRNIAQSLPATLLGKTPEPGATFRAEAERPVRQQPTRRVAGKSELVRGFFEAARSRST